MALQSKDPDLKVTSWPPAGGGDAVWPACLGPRGPASSWRWGDGGSEDAPRHEVAELHVALRGRASVTLRAESLEAPVEGRCAVTLRASRATLRRILETVASGEACRPELEDRDLLSVEVGGSRLTIDLLDATLRLTPAGSHA